jgi:hypothetical protein
MISLLVHSEYRNSSSFYNSLFEYHKDAKKRAKNISYSLRRRHVRMKLRAKRFAIIQVFDFRILSI